jgi:hypothetical protein
MAEIKWTKGKHHRIGDDCFVSISGFYLYANVRAKELFGEISKCDVYFDDKTMELRIIANPQGEYKITTPKGRRDGRICIQSIMSEIGILKKKRYEVKAVDGGLSITLERTNE